jgi:hypothetical protein
MAWVLVLGHVLMVFVLKEDVVAAWGLRRGSGPGGGDA